MADDGDGFEDSSHGRRKGRAEEMEAVVVTWDDGAVVRWAAAGAVGQEVGGDCAMGQHGAIGLA